MTRPSHLALVPVGRQDVPSREHRDQVEFWYRPSRVLPAEPRAGTRIVGGEISIWLHCRHTTENPYFRPALRLFTERSDVIEALDPRRATNIVFLSIADTCFCSVRSQSNLSRRVSIVSSRARLHTITNRIPSISTESIGCASLPRPLKNFVGHGARSPAAHRARRRNCVVFHHTANNPG